MVWTRLLIVRLRLLTPPTMTPASVDVNGYIAATNAADCLPFRQPAALQPAIRRRRARLRFRAPDSPLRSPSSEFWPARPPDIWAAHSGNPDNRHVPTHRQ